MAITLAATAYGARCQPESRRGSRRGGTAIFLCGPTGVGKFTIGFRAYLLLLRRGATVALVDLDQLGFAGSADDHNLRARNLADLWRNFAGAGATTLAAVGPIGSRGEAALYEDQLPHTRFSWHPLTAGPATIRERILSRGAGGSWAQPGDPLVGHPETHLHAVADRAIVASRDLAHLDITPVDVGSLAPEEAARLILDEAGL